MLSAFPPTSPARPRCVLAFITRSEGAGDPVAMRQLAPTLLFALGLAMLEIGSLRAQDAVPRSDCLSTSEIRDAMAARKILEPMAAVRSAVRLTHSEPLRSQLCRSKDGLQLQYEMTLLRRDGKVVRVVLNAVNGALISNRVPPERPRLDRSKPAPVVRSKPPTTDRDAADAEGRQKQQPPDRDKSLHRPEAPAVDKPKAGGLEPAPPGIGAKTMIPARQATEPPAVVH
jgi:hypothetical protein